MDKDGVAFYGDEVYTIPQLDAGRLLAALKAKIRKEKPGCSISLSMTALKDVVLVNFDLRPFDDGDEDSEHF